MSSHFSDFMTPQGPLVDSICSYKNRLLFPFLDMLSLPKAFVLTLSHLSMLKWPNLTNINLRSWVRLRGPVIQANGRLTFEDDLRSGLLCFISMNASVRTELTDSMVTPGEPGDD